MPARATGNVYESRGRWYVSITTAPKKRKSWALPTCSTEEEARARAAILADAARRLRRAGRSDVLVQILDDLAAHSGERLAATQRIVEGLLEGVEERDTVPVDAGETFGELAKKWLSGELHKAYPDHVLDVDHDKNGNRARLTKYILPHVQDVPLKAFTLDHAEDVMRKELPARSRRHIAQLLVRICRLAVYPARIITHSPIPLGWLPKPLKPRMGLYLYPEEDALLLACKRVPVARRMLEGFLAREGMRASEALGLEWRDLDLKRGVLRLEENKTDDPRAWALNPGVAEALRRWKKLVPKDAKLVFVTPDGAPIVNDRHVALRLRSDLKKAGVEREVLFESSERRMRLRAHDLRATFITLSLANGKTEQWVSDRTGHKSSVMIQRYRRAARQAEELRLGELRPMFEAIPEVAEVQASAGSETPSDDGEGGAMETTEKAVVRRAGLEPASLSALEPKTSYREATEADRGDLGSDHDDGSPPSPSVACTACTSPALRPFFETEAGERAVEALIAARATGGNLEEAVEQIPGFGDWLLRDDRFEDLVGELDLAIDLVGRSVRECRVALVELELRGEVEEQELNAAAEDWFTEITREAERAGGAS